MSYKYFVENCIKSHKLLTLQLEVNLSCNFNCVHCYQPVKKDNDILTLNEIENLIIEAKDMGCFNLIITGGEPLMRQDFKDIINHARKYKYSITLMTNGSLLTEDLIKFMKEKNITNIELSLLGSSDITYYKVTGQKNMFKKINKNIDLILKHNIHLIIKTPLIRQNIKDFKEIFAFTKNKNCLTLAGPHIMPDQSCNFSPCDNRLDDKALKNYYQYAVQTNIIRENSFGSLICNIGKVTCFITSKGDVFPCVNLPQEIGNIRETPLRDIWSDKKFYHYYNLTLEKLYACRDCDYKSYCLRCPGLAYKESKDINNKSVESCRHAKILYELFNKSSE